VTGRVVVITGASGGIGRATALEFARHGDRLALLARGETGLVAAAEEVRACGSEALALPVDTADAEPRPGSCSVGDRDGAEPNQRELSFRR
jgi:NAD(P)-dependent dehydrogenase (short-subunit alcohol dehydrogenase family)